MNEFDHVLLIGFGAPTQVTEIEPFLKRVAEGRDIPEKRLREVARRYKEIGGRSPYQDMAIKLARQLQEGLKKNNFRYPVFVGMRNGHSFLEETLAQIHAQGHRRGLGILLAPFRTETTCKRYKDNVEDAKRESKTTDLGYEYLDPWFAHPLFIEAQAEKVAEEILRHDLNPKDCRFIFTTHSIPVAMNRACPHCCYEEEFKQASSLIAKRLEITDWTCAYQSRSGSPREPWLGPDVLEVIHGAVAERKKSVFTIPIGFVCQNLEILYDLETQARKTAQDAGLEFYCASAISDQPKFIRMLQELIREKSKISVLRGGS